MGRQADFLGSALWVMLLAAVVLGGAGLRAEEAHPWMLVIQPGYPGTTKDAEGFMGTFSEYLAGNAGVPGLTAEYHNNAEKGLAAIAEKRPSFGIASAGFYLEYRKKLGLKAICQSKPGDTFVIVARKGEVKDPGQLKGKPVAGGPLYEQPYLERIVFRGNVDVASWECQPTPLTSRALRDLAGGRKYTAVVLTGRDYRAFEPLHGSKLEKVLESDPYPAAFVVLFQGTRERKGGTAPGGAQVGEETGENQKKEGAAGGEPALAAKADEKAPQALPPGVVEKLVRAFTGMAKDPKAKGILDTMGTEGFEEVPADKLASLEALYDGGNEKK